MADYQWVEVCDEPDCDGCRLGVRLVEALREADVDTSVVVLTLIRILATFIASAPTVDQPRAYTGIARQLYDDVVLLTTDATDAPGVH